MSGVTNDPEVDERLFDIARMLCRVYVSFAFRRHGDFQYPLTGYGGMLVCLSHQSEIDGLVAIAATKGYFYSLVDQELLKGHKGTVLTKLGCFGVRKNQPDRSALLTTKRLLERSGVVIWCPEGDIFRDGHLHPFRRGAEWIVKRSDFDCVLPMTVSFIDRKGRPAVVTPKFLLRQGVTFAGLLLYTIGKWRHVRNSWSFAFGAGAWVTFLFLRPKVIVEFGRGLNRDDYRHELALVDHERLVLDIQAIMAETKSRHLISSARCV